MKLLKTNTAVRVVVGPFLDATDGVTPETALTVTNCTCELFHEHDDGSAPTRAALTLSASGGSNDMVHITSDVGGYYDLELTASDVNWLGRGILSIIDTDVHLPVFVPLTVVPANVFDSLVGGTDNLQVDTVQVGGTTQTARDLGASVLLSSGTGTGQLSLSSGTVTVGTNNDKTGYTLSAAGIQAVWDALSSALTTVGSIGKRIVDYLDAAVSSRSTYAGGDTAGTTTLLSRIVGTLAAGTHNPQGGDAYARLGAPAGASVSADLASVKTDTGTTIPGRLPAALVGGRIDASVGAAAANTITASALAADAVTEITDAIKALTAADADTLTANTWLEILRRLRWILQNKLEITDATGAVVVRQDDSTTQGLGGGTVTDNSTTTIRTRIS